MQIRDLNFPQLLKLRSEITLNSLFRKDYSNSFGINEEEVNNFFDGYLDYLYEIASEDGVADNDFFEVMSDYDSEANLKNWFDIAHGW